MGRICVLGLDGLVPELVFATYWADLPHLRALAQRGLAGPLYSCHPPITVPAWSVMTTGQDPGILGVYGFNDRADRSYTRRRLASALSSPQPPIWRLLSAAGRRCRLLTVPQTYPPLPLNGMMLAGHPSPPATPLATYPPELAATMAPLAVHWEAALHGARSLPPATVLAAVRAHTDALFRQAEAWCAGDDWDFFMLVDMGPDRLQHALWSLTFPAAGAPATDPLAMALHDYYVQLDTWVGRLAGQLRPEDSLMVVSDHGAQAMTGALALNQWLLEAGYLHLRAPPGPAAPFDVAAVDWRRTRAWADGGFVGRIHLNLAGREPQGIVAESARGALLDEIEAALSALPPPPGRAPHRLLRPTQLYAECRGVPPDLWVYASQLQLRCIASMGYPGPYVAANDRGPDGANHAQHGCLLLAGPTVVPSAGPASIYDVAPTLLALAGMPVPGHWRGHALIPPAEAAPWQMASHFG